MDTLRNDHSTRNGLIPRESERVEAYEIDYAAPIARILSALLWKPSGAH